MEIAPAMSSATPPKTTSFDSPRLDRPAVSANGTVRPSERPMTLWGAQLSATLQSVMESERTHLELRRDLQAVSRHLLSALCNIHPRGHPDVGHISRAVALVLLPLSWRLPTLEVALMQEQIQGLCEVEGQRAQSRTWCWQWAEASGETRIKISRRHSDYSGFRPRSSILPRWTFGPIPARKLFMPPAARSLYCSL